MNRCTECLESRHDRCTGSAGNVGCGCIHAAPVPVSVTGSHHGPIPPTLPVTHPDVYQRVQPDEFTGQELGRIARVMDAAGVNPHASPESIVVVGQVLRHLGLLTPMNTAELDVLHMKTPPLHRHAGELPIELAQVLDDPIETDTEAALAQAEEKLARMRELADRWDDDDWNLSGPVVAAEIREALG